MKKSKKKNPSDSVAPTDTAVEPQLPSVNSSATAEVESASDSPVTKSFPIVGIGASAGGLSAFEAFFSGMPSVKDPGMAFVLVQHLAPDHKSILSELIRRYTRMQVFEVEDGMQVKPNCAYIIPPNHDMAFIQGALHLLEPLAPHGQRLPINYFFKTLADDQRELAIGIILSGTGSDGTLGIRAIKDAGGMVMAQNTDSSEFDGMPSSAIATGLVDYQLAADEMPGKLMAYVSHAFGRLPRSNVPDTPTTDNILKKIFILLRSQTGHDFAQYKPNTIYRRIERRMAVHQIKAIDVYFKFMQQTPSEVDALFRDLLIGVTHFFRDRKVFEVLEQQIIPRLFEDKPAGSAIRIWSVGCSTGEEAYSLAILLMERMETLKQSYTVQVFATDIDSRAIDTARSGVYPSSIAEDISAERLARFFTLEPGGQSYRLHKNLRDLLVFSEQDLIKDPPFSRLDLISCRNLLIYLDTSLQKKLIPLFHYALSPGAWLLLGTSEGVGEFDSLFAAMDRKAKIYQRKEDFLGLKRGSINRFLPNMTAREVGMPNRDVSTKTKFESTLPLKQLMEQTLIKRIAPASALVNAAGDILYLHGRSGMYLEPVAGEAGVQNILKMAREGLRPSLSNTLHQAVSTQHSSHAPQIKVKTNGDYTLVDVSIHPVPTSGPDSPDTPLYLVILKDAPTPVAPSGRDDGLSKSANTPTAAAEARIEELTLELRAKDEYLQSTHEELESSNEELKSSNEEMQSINEELQSTNEELETSKEELQSVNEELATVNNELQTKVTDLSQANNDMNNLLAGTGVGTVFVDFKLRIVRFTPAACDIINLIASDVGRPVAHIVSNLKNYNSLVADISSVLDTLTPKQVDVQTEQEQWFSMRIQPYRTLDNVIEGAVISFTDISPRVLAEQALNKARDELRLAVLVRDSLDAITLLGMDGRILAWNPAAERLYGWNEVQALQMNVRQMIPEPLSEKSFDTLLKQSRNEAFQPIQSQRLTQSGAVLHVSILISAVYDESGKMYAISTIERCFKD